MLLRFSCATPEPGTTTMLVMALNAANWMMGFAPAPEGATATVNPLPAFNSCSSANVAGRSWSEFAALAVSV